MTAKEKLVIVGCGMAGGKLAEELLLLSDSNLFEITVIGNEPYGNYNRIRLIELLQGGKSDDLVMNSPQWFQERGISTVFGEQVESIACAAQRVCTDVGRIIHYDYLVLATGSKPVIPQIVGAQMPGVFCFRNITDGLKIDTWLRERNKVIVVGGGLPGLELADALATLQKNVTISHFVGCLMEKNLNSEASYVLEKILVKKGINIIKEKHIIGLENNDESGEIRALFSDGSIHDTECVIINCGITPRKELAQRSGLTTETGILVDERLRTSDPHIFALGECIEFQGKTYGRLVPIYAQARVLSRVLTGGETTYDHCTAPLARMKSDIPVVAIGKIEEEDGDEVVTYNNPRSLIYKKLITREERLLGAHLVGDDLNAEALSVYYSSKLPLPKRIETLLFPGINKPGSAPTAVYWPEEVTVCDCNDISCSAIRQTIREVGIDRESVINHSRAATSCGICRSRVESIVANTYDVIVVGAGLGGLTTAARLSREGKRILLFESHDKVGGYASSFTREGYTFDASLHNMGPMNGTVHKVFETLGLDRKVDYIPFNYFQRVIFPDHQITIEKGLQQFADLLIEAFPAEREGINGIIEEMRNVREGFEVIEEMTLDGTGDEQVSPMLAIKYPQFVELVFSTYGELLEKYVQDDKLRGLLANLWWYFGLPPSELAAILYSVPGVSYIEYAGGYIKGTSQRLSDALAELIWESDGVIRLRTRVNRILVAEGKACGVLTDEGEVYYSDVVVSNAGAINTFGELIDEGEVKKKFLKKIRRLESSLSAVQLYLGLDCPPEELGMKEHSFTVFTSYDHDENYQQLLEGDYENSLYSCMSYSGVDRDLAPQGCGIINIFSLDSIKNWDNLSRPAYLEKKKIVTKKILAKVEKIIPNLSDHVVVAELATPLTMKRYTSNPEGSIFGPSQIVTQSGLNRLKTQTPIDGLYLVGSSIYPGGGYPSVISSGYRTANLILKQESSPSFFTQRGRSCGVI